MTTIGFATQFYTLWDVDSQPTYFQDSYGNTHQTGVITHYHYIKNISTDIDKVKELYPNTPIDDSLKGRNRDFSVTKEEDTTPEILKFGKYRGMSIQDVSKSDFGYILWLLENGQEKTKSVCMELPKVIEHFAKIERQEKELMDSYPVIQSGEVEIEFTTNPNRVGEELLEVYKNAKVLVGIPSTLSWVVVNEWADASAAKYKDWFTLEQSGRYKITRWKDSKGVSLDGQNYATIGEAKEAAEIQELTNKGLLSMYYKDTEFAPLLTKWYAIASLGEGNEVFVFFNEIKSVSGMYPYNMGVINGKAMKVKGKKIKVNLNVLSTKIDKYGVRQVATIID